AHFLPGPEKLKIPFRLGLDLQGGTHLVYRADTSKIPANESAEAMAGLRDVIERRINIFGVTEPLIQVEKRGDENRLIVELAGVFNVSDAIRAIGETPYLEFKILRPDAKPEDLQANEQVNANDFFVSAELGGRYLKKAVLEFDQTSLEPVVSLEFNDEGAKLFQKITKENVGKPVAIYLDGFPISVPVVREEISQGRAQISGNFTPEEARTLVRRLNSGALPVPIALVSQQSIGASLGGEALARMLKAGIYGTLAVALFLLFFYRLPGLTAVLALAIYIALLLLLFKLIPVTLTAAGIAGFILSIGMAVDANILIFERTKEELWRGRPLATAVEEGFARAWLSIRDSNASSLITSAILYWFGSSMVRGFALTLALGIAISMFSAIMVTRTFLRAVEFREGKATRFLFGAGSLKKNA
ncbi:MAG: protein translocase subunit SecD, partial [Patescibacteria group bacterium]